MVLLGPKGWPDLLALFYELTKSLVYESNREMLSKHTHHEE